MTAREDAVGERITSRQFHSGSIPEVGSVLLPLR